MRAIFFAGATVALGCGASNSAAVPAARKPPPPGVAVERYFPLEEGRIYHYVTSENGDAGMLVARVHRTDALHGELRLSNATKRFVYGPEGVAYDGGAFLLRSPLDLGASWPGEHGGTTRVTSVDASPKVAAGSYTACVETVEEGGRPPGVRYTSTYCPGVGMVVLVVSSPAGDARAELKSYGFPVKIE